MLSELSSAETTTNDPMLKIGSWFAIMYIVYFFSQVTTYEFPIVLIFWAVTLFAALAAIQARVLFFVFIVSFILGVAYTLGYAVGSTRDASLEYLPQLLTLCVGSAWILGLLQKSNRIGLPLKFHKWVHRFFLLGSLLWAVLTIQTITIGRIVDNRELTGFSYLTTSDLFAMFCIASVSRRRISTKEFFFVVFSGLLVVSLLGSRSALVLLAVVSVLIFSIRFGVKSKINSAIFLLPAVIYVAINFIDFESAAFNRLQTLFELGRDSSLQSRFYLFEGLLDRIDKNPICILVSCHPPKGEYVHNFLSIVEHFGIIGTAVLVFFFLAIIMKWRFILYSNFFPLFLFVSVSLLFTRAWISPVFAVYVGIVMFILMSRKSARRKEGQYQHLASRSFA